MTADIFSQRVQREIRAMFDRPLKHRPEQRIVARDDRRAPLGRADHFCHAADHSDIDQPIGRICRGFDKNHGNPAHTHGALCREPYRGFVDTIGKAHSADGQIRKRLCEQSFRPAIERLRVQNDVAGARERKDGGRNCRHSG